MSESGRIERLPPQNVEAEEAILGSLLIDPDAIIRVATVLRPEDFYREKNGWIYEVILSLHERREPIDFLTICDELERREQLNEVGGAAFITSLINAVPTSIHAEHYSRIVERASTRRPPASKGLPSTCWRLLETMLYRLWARRSKKTSGSRPERSRSPRVA